MTGPRYCASVLGCYCDAQGPHCGGCPLPAGRFTPAPSSTPPIADLIAAARHDLPALLAIARHDRKTCPDCVRGALLTDALVAGLFDDDPPG